jgi:hypothetical protein
VAELDTVVSAPSCWNSRCSRLRINFIRTLETKGENALQMHCIENLKQIFPEMKLRGLVPGFLNSCICEHIPTICPKTKYSKIDGPICGNI